MLNLCPLPSFSLRLVFLFATVDLLHAASCKIKHDLVRVRVCTRVLAEGKVLDFTAENRKVEIVSAGSGGRVKGRPSTMADPSETESQKSERKFVVAASRASNSCGTSGEQRKL